jgi:type IV pilus assembly protein PilY1
VDLPSNDEKTRRASAPAAAAASTRPRRPRNSLADVALYWYNGGSGTTVSSLRTSLEDWTKPGLVPAPPATTPLHMNTYTLGLGVDGIMTYDPKYDTAPKPGGDFYNLITGVATGCPWNNNGAYVWPDPKTNDQRQRRLQSRVDDLWHAAINGHGKYFSASDPKQVVAGLSSALANIQVRVGAAAAAATSTPNISQQDNDIFSDTFTTVKWYGELTDRKLDPVTGDVGKTRSGTRRTWSGARWRRPPTRAMLKMLDPTNATTRLKEFRYEPCTTNPGMNATEKAWFDNKCTALAQCATLSASRPRDRQRRQATSSTGCAASSSTPTAPSCAPTPAPRTTLPA